MGGRVQGDLEKELVNILSTKHFLLPSFQHYGNLSEPVLCSRGFWLLCFILLFLPLSISSKISTIENEADYIVLRNDVAKIVISNEAELISFVDLRTNTDIAAHNHKKIASVNTTSGEIIEASKATLHGNTLIITIGSIRVFLDVQSHEHYFTFEVKNDYLPDIESLSFVDLKLQYDYSLSDCFLAVGVAMSINTNPCYYPSGENKEVQGRCMPRSGFKGAKLAVVACKNRDLRVFLKEVYSSIPKGVVPISLAGGAFALDSEINSRDCLILGDADPSKLHQWISFYLPLGIRQFDFKMGTNTFIQGQFSFPSFGSAADFKRKIVDPLEEAGIISSLHTYSYYIGYNADDILSNSKWQQQLEFRETFTLEKSISATDKRMSITGNKTCLKNGQSSGGMYSPYLLVDNEIMKYDLGEDGHVSIQRGQCGTKIGMHKAGTKVCLIGGYYSHIAPKPGSELFYEIARRTAKAYNEGGFKGIYFDALDGLGIHLRYVGLDDYIWYYGASFINEVLKYCVVPPLVECAILYPSIWSARGRGGAWDTPSRGYKNFIDDHIAVNKSLMKCHYLTTLGWYNFYPTSTSTPAGFSTKNMFFDDVDYLGVKALAYNQTMVYNGLNESDVQSIPSMQHNIAIYSNYNRLRRERYFSDKVLSILKQGKYEYKLIRKNGRWGFDEAVYCREKIRDVVNGRLKGYNPFKRQKPFIRLENMYSSDCSSSVPLITFSENMSVGEQECEKFFDVPLNLSKHLALKVRIKGNGSESKDAVCIRLSSASTGTSTGVGDYVVRLNYEGWRDIILSNLDNAELADIKFKGMEDPLYKVHRYNVDFSRINSIQLFFSGECKKVKIQSIDAVPLVQNALTNPIVRIGKTNVSFKDAIQSGEYIEYTVGDKTAMVYDSIGNSRRISVSRSEGFCIPHGEFTASVSGIPKLENAPSEVVLTFGLYGKFIHN